MRSARLRTQLPVLLAVLALVLLSSVWSGGEHHGAMHFCAAAAVQGSECPNAVTQGSLSFHERAGQFLTGVLPSVLALLAAALFLGVGLLDRAVRTGTLHSWDFATVGEGNPRRTEQRWLARFEHSPSVLLGRTP